MGLARRAEFWVARSSRPLLFEIDGVDLATAKEAMRLGQAKAQHPTKFVARAPVKE